MRFGSNGPRSIAVGHEFLKVGGDFGEQRGGQARGHCDDAGQHARQQVAQVAEGDGAIDPQLCIGWPESMNWVMTLKVDENIGRSASRFVQRVLLHRQFVLALLLARQYW